MISINDLKEYLKVLFRLITKLKYIQSYFVQLKFFFCCNTVLSSLQDLDQKKNSYHVSHSHAF